MSGSGFRVVHVIFGEVTRVVPMEQQTDTLVRPPLPTSVEQMHRVSPKYMVPMLVTNTVWALIVIGGLLWAQWKYGGWWVWGAVVCGVFFIWKYFLIPFQVRNLAWLETDNELILSQGKMWHTLTVIPYGRIQFVDVNTGPVMRALGLKKLVVNTASVSSATTLPGLLAADADALRDRLVVKAREQMSGL